MGISRERFGCSVSLKVVFFVFWWHFPQPAVNDDLRYNDRQSSRSNNTEERKCEFFWPKTLTIKRTGRGSESSTFIIEIYPNESQKLWDLFIATTGFVFSLSRQKQYGSNRSKLIKHSVSEPKWKFNSIGTFQKLKIYMI